MSEAATVESFDVEREATEVESQSGPCDAASQCPDGPCDTGEAQQASSEPATDGATPSDGPQAQPAEPECGTITPAIRKQLQHYEEIRAQELAVADIESNYEDAKAELKSLKADLDAARGKLLRMIRAGAGAQRSLFADDDAKGKPASEAAAASDTPPADTPPVVPDAWRSLPLSELDIPKKLVDKLAAESDLKTLGDLSDRVAEHGDWWYRDLKGIGEGKAATISDAFADFWEKHPEYCQGGAPAAATEPAIAAATVADSAESAEVEPDAPADQAPADVESEPIDEADDDFDTDWDGGDDEGEEDEGEAPDEDDSAPDDAIASGASGWEDL